MSGTFTAAGDWSLTDATIGVVVVLLQPNQQDLLLRVALWEKRSFGLEGFGSVGSTHRFSKVQSGLVFVRSLRQQQLLIISLAGNLEEKSFRASRSLLSLLAFR